MRFRADVNECRGNGKICSGHSECLNTPGAFDCVCPQGFMQSKNASYTDPREVVCTQVIKS